MAAYDLNVQRPASLAVPKAPGADDLARFLSVAEATRANQAKEDLNAQAFEWDKGAGQRAAEAAEAERERVRQQNAELGRVLSDTTEGYLSGAQENFRLSDDAVSRFREAYPNASEEQIEQIRQSARNKITQDPNAYIKQQDMLRTVEDQLLKSGQYSPAEAKVAAQQRVSSYFKAPTAPNDEVVKALLDVYKTGGITDKLGKYPLGSNKDGSSGSSASSRGSNDFMKYSKFATDDQLFREENGFREGSRGIFSFNIPGTKEEIYTDDMEAMGVLAQTEEGIKPQYLNAVMIGLARDGQLPRGVTPENMLDKNSDFYKEVTNGARQLQAQMESNNGNGSGPVLSLADYGQLAQGDLEMKTQNIQALNNALQQASGGVLSADEQFQIMNDPELLQEFGILMEESIKQAGGDTATSTPPPPAAKPNPEPVEETGSREVGSDEGDNPELTSLLEGDAPVDTPPARTAETQSSRRRNIGRRFDTTDTEVAVPGLDTSNLTSQEAREALPGMTMRDMRAAIPEGADREKAYNLFTTIRSGRGSESEVEELIKMLTNAKK